MSYIDSLRLECIAYYGKTYENVGITTIREISYLRKAYRLQKLEDTLKINMLAWQIRQAEASNEKGKYYFRKFEDFYDHEKMVNKVMYGKEEEVVLDDKVNYNQLLNDNLRKIGM